jgi:heme-degrading monooxygenase HmoA
VVISTEVTLANLIPLRQERLMIVRLWRGRALPGAADAYERHVASSVFPKLQRLDGYVGGRVLRRTLDRHVEFMVLTEWSSLTAIRAFAGDALDRAVVEPEAQAILSDYDTHVEHFEVVR